jgi:hypothetical protein
MTRSDHGAQPGRSPRCLMSPLLIIFWCFLCFTGRAIALIPLRSTASGFKKGWQHPFVVPLGAAPLAANSQLMNNAAARTAIVLLDPVTEWQSVVEAALKRNLICIAVQLSPISPEMKPFFPTSSMLLESGAAHVLNRQDRDVFACVQVLKLLQRMEHDCNHLQMSIGAVIPLAETAVDFSDTLAALPGLKNHNPLDMVLCKRDKGFMKEAARQKGLRVAKFSRIYPADQIETSIHSMDLSYPIVLKTPQGFSTTDVFVCPTLGEAERAFLQILENPGPDGRTPACVLLEEYIHGIEFAVNLLATQHQSTMSNEEHFDVVVTNVWKYDKTSQARYLGAEICDPTDEGLKEIVTYAKEVARAVGIHFGAAHVELKAQSSELSDKSKTTDHLTSSAFTNPVMIEVGARLSGGRKATMTQAAFQESTAGESLWDPFDALIRSHSGALHGTLTEHQPPKLYVRHLFLPIVTSGCVRRIHSVLLQQPNRIATLHSHVFLVKEGDQVTETTDITSCAGFVWLVGEKTMVDHDAGLIWSTFRLEMEND